MPWVSERHIVAHFGARPNHIAIEKNMSWGRRLSAPVGAALLLWSGSLVAEHISRALVWFFDWLFRSNADKSVYDSFQPIGAVVAPGIDKTETASGFRR